MTATLYKGSTSSFEAAQSAAVYEAVLTVLGATGTIVPLGDPTYRTSATTNTCAAGITGLPTAVFTASEAPESFDTPPTRQGICPVIHLNGSDEHFNSPDNAYWERDDSSDEAFSVGSWVWLDSIFNAERIRAVVKQSHISCNSRISTSDVRFLIQSRREIEKT